MVIYLRSNCHLLYSLALTCPDDFYCLNGGTCVDGNCFCSSRHTGLRCEKQKGTTPNIQLIYAYNYHLITS